MKLIDRARPFRDAIAIETPGPTNRSMFLCVYQSLRHSEYVLTSGVWGEVKPVLHIIVPSTFYRRTAREVRCVGR